LAARVLEAVMRDERNNRLSRYSINPFVVLCDITILLLLVLLVYFTALVVVLRQQVGRGHKEVAVLRQQIASSQRILEISREEEARVKKRSDYQADVATILRDPRLKFYHDRRQIEVYSEGDIQVFSFGEQVLFGTGRSDLSPGGKGVLLTFGSVLTEKLERKVRKFGYPEIQIQGHTDTVKADNWLLSTLRALAVLKAFSYQNGLRRAYMSAAGYSCHRPWVNPQVGKDQPRNRRIEVRLIYSQKFVGGKPFDCGCDR
jgi:flagellar motor protein MotB